MEGYVIVLSILSALLGAAYALRPVLQPEVSENTAALDNHFQNLLDQKERCVQVLRDLELDFATGKIEEEEYKKMKLGMMAEMASVLSELDKHAHD